MYPSLGRGRAACTFTVAPWDAPIPEVAPHGRQRLGCLREQLGGDRHTCTLPPPDALIPELVPHGWWGLGCICRGGGGGGAVHTRTIPPQGAPIPQPAPHAQQGPAGICRWVGAGLYTREPSLTPNRPPMAAGDSSVSDAGWVGGWVGGCTHPHHTLMGRPYPPNGTSWPAGTWVHLSPLGGGGGYTPAPYPHGTPLLPNRPRIGCILPLLNYSCSTQQHRKGWGVVESFRTLPQCHTTRGSTHCKWPIALPHWVKEA